MSSGGFVLSLSNVKSKKPIQTKSALLSVEPVQQTKTEYITEFSLEDQARLEILRDVSDVQDVMKDDNRVIPLSKKENPELPLLLRNPIPGLSISSSDTDKYKRHMELLPDEQSPTSSVYKSVPIDVIGSALLRGMGWSEGKGIGKNAKEPVKIIEPVLHPSGLGLGANPMPVLKMGAFRPKPGEDIIDLKYQIGAYIGVMNGKFRGYNGIIIKMIRNNGNIDMHVNLEDVDKPQVFSKNDLKLIGNLKDFDNFLRNYQKRESRKHSNHKRSSSHSRSRSRSRSHHRRH